MKNHILKTSLIALLLISLVNSSSAKDKKSPENIETPNVVIVEYGLYGFAKETGKINTQNSITGTIAVIDPLAGPSLLKQTIEIDAKLGTRFGIRILLKGSGPYGKILPVDIRVHHPEITNPATKKSSILDQWSAGAQLGIPRFQGWKFENKYEMVAGSWKFEVVHNNKVLAEQSFNIKIK